ncbi:MAG: S8 family serine peptidase [Verrucomicrobiae bacterium]|nr:S8 family serine peptidase [Verrucomicrobiae bacterium]
MKRVAGLVLGILGVAGIIPEGAAYVRTIETSVEYRFAHPEERRWHLTQTVALRHAPEALGWQEVTTREGTRRGRMGSRVVLGVGEGVAFPGEEVVRWGLRVDRTVGERLWILQARDVRAAAEAAAALAGRSGVEVAVPVMRRSLAQHLPFGPRLNDPYFTSQWHLENREADGTRVGPDLNPRGAWTATRGTGVVIGIADDGFETDHPDLAAAAALATGLHYDFTRGSATAAVYGGHGTCVAGLAGATGDNRVGVSGVAPAAGLASWAIFDRFGDIASDERLMDMFEHRIQEVAVQNHSWGNADTALYAPSALEAAAIGNAVDRGREGRGVILVRSGGNGRAWGMDVNDDGYPNDPRAIAVAAVRRDGRVTSYSSPGACLLVGALSGDDDDEGPSDNLFTTDRVGARGYNTRAYADDRANYAFGDTGFFGTSGSAPQVAGLAALILSARPELGYRDVQQILLHSARHWDLADPSVRTNGAGYRVSHNQGFGVPDATEAVRLALTWEPRPPVMRVTERVSGVLAVPGDGPSVWIREGSAAERRVAAQYALGPHPDAPTERLPLAYVGRALGPIGEDLGGRAALIERGEIFFREKIDHVARAGAAFAVIYNNVDGDALIIPGGTEFSPIPAAFVSENEGRALVARLEAGEAVEAQLRLESVERTLVVTDTLICEHVGLRVRARHGRRGDMRITLLSPSGTRSVMQRLNYDEEAGPQNWTYWSTQHFYEPSAGNWVVTFSDQAEGVAGEILEVELIIRGVPIADTDGDGLDDAWEMRWFGNLDAGPAEDPDRDGSSNAREQALGTDPTREEREFRVVVAPYDEQSLRLSWPATPHAEYGVLVGEGAGLLATEVGRVSGAFPEGEWIVPVGREENRFFLIEARPLE